MPVERVSSELNQEDVFAFVIFSFSAMADTMITMVDQGEKWTLEVVSN